MANAKLYFLNTGIIILFLIVVSSAVYYVQTHFTLIGSCGCTTSLTAILVFLASFGLLTGSVTYYFNIKSFERKTEYTSERIKKTLQFVSTDEKKIIQILVKNKGKLYQNKIIQETKLTPVKIHRIISQLEQKKIINKQKKGMSNYITLDEDLYELYK